VSDAVASADLMDRIYRRQRHLYDFTRKYYLLGRDRLIERLAPPAGCRVLEIGCGTARNLVTAAHTWRDVQFFGIDISAEMLEAARRLVERAGLAPDIRLARADATTFDPALIFGVPGFSRIFVSYSLSMMPGWGRPCWTGRSAACCLAGNCTSSISAARKSCCAGSAARCAAGSRCSMSGRATNCRAHLRRVRS
jgi:S-adenosylmethionine-diacylgycerolhomoserine-N-methlytransferase